MTTVLELKARLDALLSTAQVETANIDLFAPVAEREECPICMIPLPLLNSQSLFMSCCGKMICTGCIYKQWTNVPENKQKCAFCQRQQTVEKASRDHIKATKKLMKKNNPQAFMMMADAYRLGSDGVLQSDTKALEMRICAAELGHARAFGYIGQSYKLGVVVEQDRSKSMKFYRVAAKKGSISAHKNLAILHERIKNNELCVKHVKVAASAGDQESMNSLMHMYTMYKDKILSKVELTQTLRDFQSSQNEMKSKDRDDERMQRLKRDSRDHTSE